MPNLEYSVRFVLASDSTTEIDQALAKMRDTGSTITIKVNADASGFDSEMKKVNAEIQKTEASNEKLSRSAQKGSGLFKMYAKDIREALNQFRATGKVEEASAEFARITSNVEAFGVSMKDSSKGMQEFYTLTNQITTATATLNRERNNSAGVIKANEAVQRALNEETKKSAQILATRARASAFDARQTKQNAQEVRDNVAGQIALLRRLSVQGRGTAEEIAIAFNRTANTTEELQVTTDDLTQAFVRQQKAVEGSRMSFKNKQQTINQLKVAEEQTAQSMRKTTAGLSQQENQVGDVSYAMVSFTRLLEDIPYGFRGFANNIQPTIYGLIQMNEVTEGAALQFRQMHGKEMPLAQRAMLNLKSALSSPINQLLLLTSVIAVAGTMIERWSQNSKKAAQNTKELGDEILNVFEIAKQDDPLDRDYSQSIASMEAFSSALAIVSEELEKQTEAEKARMMFMNDGAMFGGREERESQLELIKGDEKRYGISKQLVTSVSDRVEKMRDEAVQSDIILKNEAARNQFVLGMLRSRDDAASKQVQSLQEEIQIERIRQTQGDEAAAREKHRLALERLKSDEYGTQNDLNLINLQLQMDLLRIKKDENKEIKEIRNEYDGILLSLQRQLEDETKMSDMARLGVTRRREIADVEAQIAQRRKDGEDVSVEAEKELISLINQRHDIIEAREQRARARTVQAYNEQNYLSGVQNYILGLQLDGEFERADLISSYADSLQQQVDLAELSYEVSQMEGLSDEERLTHLKLRTELLEQEYQIKLKNRVLDARSEVANFLAPELSPIGQIKERTNSALLASERSFLAEKTSIEQQYAEGTAARESALTAMYAREEAERKAIALKGTTEIQAIRTMGEIEGAMMIIGALQQLNQSSEATNRARFESQKRVSASLATINTLLGITQVLRDEKLDTTAKFISAAALALTGFAQVRQIMSTQYGGSSTGGRVGAPSMSEGFVESDVQARQGVNGTMNSFQPQMIVNVTGTVDREGIAWAVMEGTDQINSRGIVLQ